MNCDGKFFDEITQAATRPIEGRICLASIQDSRKKLYAKEFTDNLLLSLLHCTRSEYQTPQKALEIAFSAGFFCQMLDSMCERDDMEKTNFILSVLGDNVFTMDGRMVGILLNCQAETIKNEHDELKKRAVEGCQFLTYQSVWDMPVTELYTMCFAMFLVGCSVNTRYKHK